MGLPKTLNRLGNVCLVLTVIGMAGLFFNANWYGGDGFESFTEIGNQPFFRKGFWWILLCGSMFGASLFHVGALIAGKSLYHRLVKNGQDADAKVLNLIDTGTRINNDPLIKFSLEVQPPDRPSFRTEVQQTVSVIFLPSLQPGKLVRVKYLPGTDKIAVVGTKTSSDRR